MTLKRLPELHAFLSTSFSDSDPETDESSTQAFVSRTSSERRQQVATQMRSWLAGSDLSLEELGSEANRWFGDLEEARAWLQSLLKMLDQDGASNGSSLVVKDSNGAQLSEGDSVTVIKDLKVKGGSSDLKRGTLIKKIHLIDDTENIECKVNGSTLVLKTCFLKKA